MAVELPTPEARVITDVSYDFSGRSVLITGAARGVGRSHAPGFGDAGASLVICDIREAELEETAEICRDAGADVDIFGAEVLEQHGGERDRLRRAGEARRAVGVGRAGRAVETRAVRIEGIVDAHRRELIGALGSCRERLGPGPWIFGDVSELDALSAAD